MFRLPLLLLLLSSLAVAPVAALDQDSARTALERGEIRPLDQVLAAARAAVPGDVISVNLKQKKGNWHYKLKVLTAAGKRREVKIDAKTLAILSDDGDDDDDD